jgi:hypothetical protein
MPESQPEPTQEVEVTTPVRKFVYEITDSNQYVTIQVEHGLGTPDVQTSVRSFGGQVTHISSRVINENTISITPQEYTSEIHGGNVQPYLKKGDRIIVIG